MIAVLFDEIGIAKYMRHNATELKAGEISFETLTPAPEAKEDEKPILRLVDGEAVWEVIPYIPPEEPHAPTHEEIEAARAAAYRATVDPLTCEIARLRDMGGSAEEISEAEARREAAVAAIKAQWPYPEGAE